MIKFDRKNISNKINNNKKNEDQIWKMKKIEGGLNWKRILIL
jgi:hypothetical protein